MKTMTPKRHVVDLLFTIALFGVFAASALLVVLIGANVYKSTVRGMNANFNMQTSLTYVAAKVRQNDTEDAVSVGELDGLPALVLRQTVGENVYHTLIYEYDGKLCEIFTRADNPVTPAEGNAIMDVDSFNMEQLESGLFRFSCSDSGGKASEVTVRARCAVETTANAAAETPAATTAQAAAEASAETHPSATAASASAETSAATTAQAATETSVATTAQTATETQPSTATAPEAEAVL